MAICRNRPISSANSAEPAAAQPLRRAGPAAAKRHPLQLARADSPRGHQRGLVAGLPGGVAGRGPAAARSAGSHAMTALIDGTLPQPPEHTWWLYGHPGGVQTVPMKPGSDKAG